MVLNFINFNFYLSYAQTAVSNTSYVYIVYYMRMATSFYLYVQKDS